MQIKPEVKKYDSKKPWWHYLVYTGVLSGVILSVVMIVKLFDVDYTVRDFTWDTQSGDNTWLDTGREVDNSLFRKNINYNRNIVYEDGRLYVDINTSSKGGTVKLLIDGEESEEFRLGRNDTLAIMEMVLPEDFTARAAKLIFISGEETKEYDVVVEQFSERAAAPARENEAAAPAEVQAEVPNFEKEVVLKVK